MSNPVGAQRYGLGGGDAYYDAVKYGGYTGTREQFGRDQAEFAQNATAVAQAREEVERNTQTVVNTAQTFTEETVPAAIQSVEEKGDTEEDRLEARTTELVEAVNTAGAVQVQAVEDEGGTQVQRVTDTATGAVDAVTAEGTRQIGLVEGAGTIQVGNVNSAGTTQVDNVNSAGSIQVQAVNTAGGNQVQAVQDKGTQVLNSIPADYTELTEDVDKMNEEFELIEGSVWQKELADLPTSTLSLLDILITDEGQKVITGTHNVAELIGIKEGTFIINNTTITVNGTTVTVSGTPSDTIYFDFVSGTNNYAGLSQGTLALPNGILYTLSQKILSGSTIPNLGIRKKSGGNVVIAQNNTAQFTMDTSTCGLLYIILNSGTAYNVTFNICVLPFADTNASPYREESSDVTVYDESGKYNALGYTWKVGNPTVYVLGSKLPRKCYCVYSTKELPYSSMIQRLDIYIPSKVGYVNYIFGRTVDNTSHGDVWRLVQIDAVNETFEYRFHITQLGETEMAIKIADRDDFIGGSTHGDEASIEGSLVFVMDGKIVEDITDVTTRTEFETLQVFLASNMYDPADHTTLVGVHGREWIFNKEGMYLGQMVEFKGSLSLTNSYMPMFPVIRGNDTASILQITDTYIDDGDYQQYDVGTGGFETYPKQLKTDVREINLFGKENGVRVTVKILEQPEELKGKGVYLSNVVNTYNKIYCTICGYGGGSSTYEEVGNGTKWKTKTQFIVEVG